LVAAREYFKEDLEPVDGKIHVGLYNHDFGSADPVARASAVLTGLEKAPFISEDFPFHADVSRVLRDYIADWEERSEIQTAEASSKEENDDDKPKPYLHMKTQFFATDPGLDILRQKEWVSIVRRWGEIRTKQYLGEENEGMTPLALVEFDKEKGVEPITLAFESWLEKNRPDDRDKAIYAFTIGSFNMDRRGMLSDGEVTAVCGGYTALIGVIDMFTLSATADWPATQDELEELFPEPNMSTRMKRISRYLQDFF